MTSSQRPIHPAFARRRALSCASIGAKQSTSGMPPHASGSEQNGRQTSSPGEHRSALGDPRPATPVTNEYARYVDQAYYEPTFLEKWSPLVQIKIAMYFAVCLCMLMLLPNSIYSPELREVTYIIGILGVWRYGWWFNHFARAKIYEKIAYPRAAARAKEVWDSGWRPRHIHIQMTTFREHREISEAVISGLVNQIRECGVPATLWLGSSERPDEDKIANYLKIVGADCNITLKIIRQNQPGKRVAIALILRAMSRAMVPKGDIVVFMDGDFVMHPGCLRKCLPLFAIDPGLHALTTNEDVLVKGPWWMSPWLNMRFAQRRLAMQSHALSGRVLTLTGRMSVFRAEHIMKEEFIRLQEADFLNHWLWGTFRFLSGDDKSTWYTLLKYGVRMTYVPDANGTTIEVVEGNGYRRMVENLRRWSGNMLRNGYRAILLGPTKMPFFIWWCLIDQRLARALRHDQSGLAVFCRLRRLHRHYAHDPIDGPVDLRAQSRNELCLDALY
jgi:mannuronan synthase